MKDEFKNKLIEEMESFEKKGWKSMIMINFPSEEKLYVVSPAGWRRNEDYCKMENYIGASEDRKNAINFSKLCRAAYKYFPELWSDSIVE